MPTGLAHRHLYSILTSSLTASSRTLILKSHHLSYGIQDTHISLGGHKSSHSRCDLSQEPDMVPFLSLGTQHVYNCQMISLNNEQRCLTQPVLQATKSQVCCPLPIHPLMPLHAQGGFVVDIGDVYLQEMVSASPPGNPWLPARDVLSESTLVTPSCPRLPGPKA